MKKNVQNAAKAVKSMLLAGILMVAATTASWAYCDFVVTDGSGNLTAVEGIQMGLNYVRVDGTVVQPWSFERDAGGNLILREADFDPATDPTDAIRAKDGYADIDSENPIPLLERGKSYQVTIFTGVYWLQEDPDNDYGENAEPFELQYTNNTDVAVYIDWDDNNEFDSDEKAASNENQGPWEPHALTIQVPSDAAAGKIRMRVVMDWNGSADITACKTDVGEGRDYYLEVARSPYDAGIAGIVSPVEGETIKEQNYDIIVTLRNDGSEDMTSCDIIWGVNGTENTYSWTGDLAPGEKENVTVGNYTFKKLAKITEYTVKATSSKPNGEIDDETGNDSYEATYGMPLPAETYYIGGLQSDFSSFVDMAETLQNLGLEGEGDYKFLFRPGTYSGQVTLDGDVFGYEGGNLFFMPDPAETGIVEFSHTITGYGNANFLIHLNSISNVTFEDFVFTIRDGIDDDMELGRIFNITGECNDITIKGNTFNGVPNTDNANWWVDGMLIYDELNTGSNITITENIFKNGGVGYFGAVPEEASRRNLLVDDNEFIRFSLCGIRSSGIEKAVISNNKLTAQTDAMYGIYGSAIERIEKNGITGFIGSASGATAIRMSNTDYMLPAYIVDNTINGCDGVNGMLLYNLYGGEISNNLVDITNQNTALINGIFLTGDAFLNDDDAAKVNLENNTFKTQNGHCLAVIDASANIGGNTFLTKDINADATTACAFLRGSNAFLAGNEVITNDVGFYNIDGTVTCVYNSVQATGANQAFYHGGTASETSVYYRNQFANSGTGVAFFINDADNPFISNENNFYTRGADLGIYNGMIITDFEEVKETLGMNSRSENPFFVTDESCIISRYNPNMFFTYPVSELDEDFVWAAGFQEMYEEYTIDNKYRKNTYYIGSYNVFPRVEKIKQSKELIACSGEENPSIYCSGKANAGAQPMYRWYKDGVAVPGADEYKLIFKEFDYTTSGVYTCEIFTPGVDKSVWSDPISVYALSEPEIISEPESVIDAMLGDNFLFEVDAHYRGKVPPMYEHDFQWYRYDDDKQIHEMLQNGEHFNGVKSKSLSLVNLTEGLICDEGDYYYCEVTAQCGTVRTSPFIISEQPDIVFETQPESVTDCPGTTVQFTATAVVPEGYEIDYQWKYNGANLSDDDKFSGSTTDVLEISDIEAADEGVFSCIAAISGQTVQAESKQCELTVKEELTAQAIAEEVEIVRQNDGTLEVEILSGDNIEHVTWIFKGNVLKEGAWDANDDAYNADLLVYEIIDAKEKQDNGTYTCRIKNECQEIEIDIEVLVPMWDENGGGNGGPAGIVADYNGHKLYEAYPNPAGSTAEIKFEMPTATFATVTLADANGNKAAVLFDAIANKGINTLTLNADNLNLASGVYYYTVTTDSFTATSSVVIVK